MSIFFPQITEVQGNSLPPSSFFLSFLPSFHLLSLLRGRRVPVCFSLKQQEDRQRLPRPRFFTGFTLIKKTHSNNFYLKTWEL